MSIQTQTKRTRATLSRHRISKMRMIGRSESRSEMKTTGAGLEKTDKRCRNENESTTLNESEKRSEKRE